MHFYTMYNHAMITTTAFTPVTTGSGVAKTMLQLAVPSTRKFRIWEWGYLVDALPTTPSKIELLDTDVAASAGTAHVIAGVQPLDNMGNAGAGISSLATLGVAATGYTFATENVTTASRLLDVDYIDDTPTSASMRFVRQLNPVTAIWVAPSRFVRLRVNFGSAVNMLCWMKWSE